MAQIERIDYIRAMSLRTIRYGLTALALSVVLGMLPWKAYAVPYGYIDGGEYPYVGFVLMGRSVGSGVMIAPDVVLTAAHVAESFVSGSSTFGTAAQPLLSPGPLVSIASSIVHPSYDRSELLFDFGLLFLAEPIALAGYATLWPSDADSLLGVDVEAVGYGGSTMARRVGDASVDNVDRSWLISVSDFDKAVVEPGDSGGGVFVDMDGQNVLAGTSSFIFDRYGYFGAVDQARSFIDEYVPDATWYGESVAPVRVSEPATLAMLTMGLVGIAGCSFRIRPTGKA